MYVLTSNQFSYLLPKHAQFFNKYWPNQEVTILCYDIPKVKLPDNFELKSIGTQTKDLAPVVKYFTEQSKDDYFILTLEDQFLIDHVDVNKIKKLENLLQNGADKASLHFYNKGEVIDIGDGVVEYKQDIHYRTSLQPAIWTKKYLLRHLHPYYNFWKFELQHDKTKNDGAKIVLLKEQISPNVIYNHINIYLRGKMEKYCFRVKKNLTSNGLIHEEDVELLKDL
jgi:hypothetical protein